MNLKQAQEHFLRDSKYRQMYARQEEGITLAIHLLAARKESGISLPKLADELGINKYDISKIENLKAQIKPCWVVSVLVKRFEPELRKRGIAVDKWFVEKPPNERPTTHLPITDSSGVISLDLRVRNGGRLSPKIEKNRTKATPKYETKS